MAMVRITFQVVKVAAERTVKCACGKSTKRRKTFERTINPFNKNADGSVKSASEVRAQAQAEADAWKPGKYICNACKGPQK